MAALLRLPLPPRLPARPSPRRAAPLAAAELPLGANPPSPPLKGEEQPARLCFWYTAAGVNHRGNNGKMQLC